MGLVDKLWDDVVAGPKPDDQSLVNRRTGSDKGSYGGEDSGPGSMAIKRMLERRRSAEFQRQQEEAQQVITGSSASSSKLASSIPINIVADNSKLSTSPSAASSISTSPPASPSSPLPSPIAREKENVWRSVFHPGSNHVMRKIGSDKFDKAQPNSPTVYDWLYSGETKSSWR